AASAGRRAGGRENGGLPPPRNQGPSPTRCSQTSAGGLILFPIEMAARALARIGAPAMRRVSTSRLPRRGGGPETNMKKDPAKFAKRAVDVEPFLVMEVLERAQALEREGRSIIHLEVGEPDFATPPEILAAGTAAIERGETHYTHSLGLAELREAIAARYRE